VYLFFSVIDLSMAINSFSPVNQHNQDTISGFIYHDVEDRTTMYNNDGFTTRIVGSYVRRTSSSLQQRAERERETPHECKTLPLEADDAFPERALSLTVARQRFRHRHHPIDRLALHASPRSAVARAPGWPPLFTFSGRENPLASHPLWLGSAARLTLALDSLSLASPPASPPAPAPPSPADATPASSPVASPASGSGPPRVAPFYINPRSLVRPRLPPPGGK